MPFQKGQSGNPSGRHAKSPQQKEFEKKCQEYSLVALNKIYSMMTMTGSKHEDVKWAIETILDRGFGRPVSPQTMDLDINEQSNPTFIEIAAKSSAIAASLARRIEPVSIRSLESDRVDTGK